MTACVRVLLGLLASTLGCAALPSPTDADMIVTAQDAPTLCTGLPPYVSLSPDGNTVAWCQSPNVMLRNLLNGATQPYAVPAEFLTGPPEFSPSGRYIAGSGSQNGNFFVYIIDRQGATITQPLPYGCTSAPAWSNTADTFALVCSDYIMRTFDATNPNEVAQIPPSTALEHCGNPEFLTVASVSPDIQQAVTVCYSTDGAGDHVVTWSYAGGVAVTTNNVPMASSPGGDPLLIYPDLVGASAFAGSPRAPYEVVVTGKGVFTVDTTDNLKITRMLDDNFAFQMQYTADGRDLVASMAFGFGRVRLQAWHARGSSDPYFASRGKFWYNFALSNNNTLGACDLAGNFHVWHLPR